MALWAVRESREETIEAIYEILDQYKNYPDGQARAGQIRD